MLAQTLQLKYQKQKTLWVSTQKRALNSFSINHVENTEIEKLIKNFNHNKSLGPCSISVKVLKNQANDLKQLLPFLINLSFLQGFSGRHLKCKIDTHS